MVLLGSTGCRGRTVLVAVLVFLLFGVTSVFAAPQFNINAPQRVRVGEPLKVHVTIDSALDQLTATLIDTGTDKRVVGKKWRRIRPNQEYAIKTPLAAGQHSFTLQLEAQVGSEISRIEFPLKVLVVRSLDVQVTKSGLDPKSGQLHLSAKSLIGTVNIEVFDRDGSSFYVQNYDFSSAPKTGRFDISFEPIPEDTIFRLELKVADIAGQWRRFKFVRWFTEIPHEDVVFESAKWAISDAESKKLDHDILLLEREVKAFRTTVGRADVAFDVTLYIGGMTDTVGTKHDNQRLSLRRARAIGLYFRQRGFRMPIRIAGFGESAPRVQTPDETPEAKNRRAVYILTSGTAPKLTPPSGRWESL